MSEQTAQPQPNQVPLHIVLPIDRSDSVDTLRDASTTGQRLDIAGRHWTVIGWSDLPNYVPDGFIMFTLKESPLPDVVPFDPWKAGQV